MKNLTDIEIKRAFTKWYSKYQHSNNEDGLAPFCNSDIQPFKPNEKSWLKHARTGLFLSADMVAKRLQVSRSAYSKYEACEKTGAITLASLARAAEAIDCELVYAIRPKSKKLFSQIIWEKLFPISLKHPWLNKCDQKRKGEALAYIALNNMNDTKIRKEQGWSQRANG